MSARHYCTFAGGDLELNWSDTDNCVYMTGPAVEVFLVSGRINRTIHGNSGGYRWG